MQVPTEKGIKPENLSYMWVISSGKYSKPLYYLNTMQDVLQYPPQKCLDGIKGKLMTDGYQAYASLAEQNLEARLRRQRLKKLLCYTKPKKNPLK